jgi:hypothetical protein
MAGNDAIAQRMAVLHTEMVSTMYGERIQLDERAGVKQRVDPLPCGLFSTLMLLLHRLRIADRSLRPTTPQFLDLMLRCPAHRRAGK